MIHTFKDILHFFVRSTFLLNLQTLLRCFLVCFAKVCLMMSLPLLFIVSWPLVAIGLWPIVLCHVSWDPPFTWNSEQAEILHNVVVFLRILQNVVVFIMIFIWVHVEERSYVFLGFTIWISHEFLCCTMRIVLVRLQNVQGSNLLWNLSWNLCRIWKVKLSLQVHTLGDLVSFVQYQLPYVSKSCWIIFNLAFRFAFYFPTTVLFMSELFMFEKTWSRIELSELMGLQKVLFVSLRMICKTLI